LRSPGPYDSNLGANADSAPYGAAAHPPRRNVSTLVELSIAFEGFSPLLIEYQKEYRNG